MSNINSKYYDASGLLLLPKFVSASTEDKIQRFFGHEDWTDQARQVYGENTKRLIPSWGEQLIKDIVWCGYTSFPQLESFNQMTVFHHDKHHIATDCQSRGPALAYVVLGGSSKIQFSRAEIDPIEFTVDTGSVVLLQDEIRNYYQCDITSTDDTNRFVLVFRTCRTNERRDCIFE